MSDWIDKVYQERVRGRRRALSQWAHRAVNARYPGCTLEYCCACGKPTGRAGRGEDSLYTDDGEGPFCVECFPEGGECEA